MIEDKVEIIRDWFIPWIFEGYDEDDMQEGWESEEYRRLCFRYSRFIPHKPY